MMKGPINMAINPPVDATKTPEWAALQKHYDELQSEGISLKQWFADDAERVEKLSFDAGDLHFDLSKNLIKPETLQLFADLAKAVKTAGWDGEWFVRAYDAYSRKVARTYNTLFQSV